MVHFLGEELYRRLISIQDQVFKLNSVNYTIGELFKLIIESLGSLNEDDLAKLGVKEKVSELLGAEYKGSLKLFHKESDLPYESDDEDAPAAYSASGAFSANRKFIKHAVEGDGNCLFNAAIYGARLIGKAVPADQVVFRVQIRSVLTMQLLEQ